MFELISAPETRTNPSAACRFLVQLVSKSDRKIVDVCVVEPTKSAIATLLQATGRFNGCEIDSYWVPTDCDCF